VISKSTPALQAFSNRQAENHKTRTRRRISIRRIHSRRNYNRNGQ